GFAEVALTQPNRRDCLNCVGRRKRMLDRLRDVERLVAVLEGFVELAAVHERLGQRRVAQRAPCAVSNSFELVDGASQRLGRLGEHLARPVDASEAIGGCLIRPGLATMEGEMLPAATGPLARAVDEFVRGGPGGGSG